MSGSMLFLFCVPQDTSLASYSQSTLDSLEAICRTARHIFYRSPDGISLLVFAVTIIAVAAGIASAVFAFLTFLAERKYQRVLKETTQKLEKSKEILDEIERMKEKSKRLGLIAKEQSEALTPHVKNFADTLLASAEQLKLPGEMKKFVKTMTDGIMLYGDYSAEVTRLFVAEGDAFDAAVKFFRMRGAASEEIVGHTIDLLERRLKIEKEKSPPEQKIEVAEKLTQAITELKAQEQSFKQEREQPRKLRGSRKKKK